MLKFQFDNCHQDRRKKPRNSILSKEAISDKACIPTPKFGKEDGLRRSCKMKNGGRGKEKGYLFL